jgi:hypothetical protein
MVTETCKNCKRIIGELEQAYAWQNHILCKECYTRLSSPTLSSPNHQDLRRLQKPIDVQLPARSIVKSTLIVIGVIIAVAIAFAILAGLLQYLTFHWGQFKSTGEW